MAADIPSQLIARDGASAAFTRTADAAERAAEALRALSDLPQLRAEADPSSDPHGDPAA